MSEFKSILKVESFDTKGYGIEILVQYPGNVKDDFKGENMFIFHRIGRDIENHMRKIHNAKDPERISNRKEEREEIISLFTQPIYVEEIPNEYCSDGCCADRPWFIITTNIGRIKIGWRKRVIEIDWSDSLQKKTANELFINEEVTKVDKSIHAWSLGKAKEYIEKITKEEINEV